MKRAEQGSRRGGSGRLLDQLELQLGELVALSSEGTSRRAPAVDRVSTKIRKLDEKITETVEFGVLEGRLARTRGLYVPPVQEDNRRAANLAESSKRRAGRRKLFEPADLQKAALAIEATRRIDVLFQVEREINGKTPNRAPRRARHGGWPSQLDVCGSDAGGHRAAAHADRDLQA